MLMNSGKRADGGFLLARTLREAGVDEVFALHGGHLEAFYKGCRDHDVTLVDLRHEAAAGNAAEGYARATGRLGVCAVTAGPGFANAIPALLNAQVDATPLLCITSAPPLREAETNALQGGFDQIAMAVPGVKWAHRVTNPERIPDLVAMAVRQATTGRRGAVLLEIPIDVLHMPVALSSASSPSGLHVAPRPAPSPDETSRLVSLLRAAKRPAIIVGGEARFSECQRALEEFASLAEIPVFASKRGLGLMRADHPMNAHDAGNLGRLTASGGEGPDVVLLLGTRLGLFLGGRGYGVLPKSAKLIQVYSDAGELGRIRDNALSIQADSRSCLEALIAQGDALRSDDRDAWVAQAVALQFAARDDYPDREGPGGVHPFHAARAVADCFGPEAIYAIDGGEAGQWAVQQARVNHPGHVMTTGYLGGLGVAQGYAIGAQRAAPDRRVVIVTGDGSLGFNLPELDTMVRWSMPIVTVVLNNEVWGMSIHGQQIMFGQNYSAISKLGGTNYADIAAGFGCHSERVTRWNEVGPALERAKASNRPALVEIMTDPAVVSPGLVNMLGKVEDPEREIMIPYYENMPIDA